jgi:hypothetical protein
MANPDVGMYFKCMPPIVVPISDRAKARLGWTGFYDGYIFLENPVEEVLALFDEDWVVVDLEEFNGEVVKLATIKTLH